MIGSSFYSFDDISTSDPKLIRQSLCISEDQLKILNDLPGWSKVDEDLNVQGIIKGTESTILSSQAYELESEVYSSNNKKINHSSNKNIELFNNHLEDRRKILQNCQFGSRKRNRSSSAIESLKKHPDFSKIASVKRTLSTPHININFEYLTSKRLYSESLNKGKQFVLNETDTLSSGSHTRSKDLFTDTVNKNSSSLDNFRPNIPIQSQTCNRKQISEIMEVITQLPVSVSHSQKVDNAEVMVEIQVNQDVSSNVQIPSSQLGNSYQINGNVTESCASNHLNVKNLHESVSLHETKISDKNELISFTDPMISKNNMQKEKTELEIVLPHGDKVKSTSASSMLKEQDKETIPSRNVDGDKAESNSLACAGTQPKEQSKETVQGTNEMPDKIKMDSFKKPAASENSMLSFITPVISESNMQKEKPTSKAVTLHTADGDKVESNSSTFVCTLPEEQDKETVQEPNEISDKMETDSFHKLTASESSMLPCLKPIISENGMQGKEPERETVPLHTADGDKIESNSSASVMSKGEDKNTVHVPDEMPDKMEVDYFNKPTTSENSMSQEKQVEINTESQNAIQIVVKEVSPGSSGERTLPQVNSTCNPPGNHENYNLQSVQKSHQEVINISADKPLDNPITVKRKADSKRSSKKHKSEKKGHTHRSVKKAGNITYSKEEIETMLNILKLFS